MEDIKSNIMALLNSDITDGTLRRETGISQGTIRRLRSGEFSVGKISLDYAVKLNDCYMKHNNVILSKIISGSINKGKRLSVLTYSEGEEEPLEAVRLLMETLDDSMDDEHRNHIKSLLFMIADKIGYNNYYWTIKDDERVSHTDDGTINVADDVKVELLKLLVEDLQK
jgi:hypothetical protein